MIFEIPIEPKPQSRPRATIRGRHAAVYEDPKMMRWRKQVTDYIKENYDGCYFDGPVILDVTFYMVAPKTISKKPSNKSKPGTIQKYQDFISELIPHDKKIDLDNLEKALYDSITKSEIVWKDDSQIVQHTTRKIYSPTPRIVVEVNHYEKSK